MGRVSASGQKNNYAIAGGLQMTYGFCRVPAAWAILLVLLGLLMGALPGAARAQGDLLAVTDIAVDVTADSAQAARDAALAEAQRKAFDQLMQRIVAPQDLARVAQVGDTQIADMVYDFDIAGEQASAVRYIGTLNFRFDGAMVRGLLDSYGVAYQIPSEIAAPVGGQAGGGVLVVLPVFSTATESRLFEGPSLWRDAWAAARPAGGLQMVVPQGNPDEMDLIDAETALLGELDGLALIAGRYRSDTVLVAEARLVKDANGERAIAVLAQRYGPAGLEDTFNDEVPAAGVAFEPAFVEAVQRVVQHTAQTWSRAAAPTAPTKPVVSGPEHSIQVAVAIRQLSDWVDVQQRLAQVPSVTRTEVLSLQRTEVRFDLYHVGDEAQLVGQLAQAQLDLSPSATPGWWLLRQAY